MHENGSAGKQKVIIMTWLVAPAFNPCPAYNAAYSEK